MTIVSSEEQCEDFCNLNKEAEVWMNSKKYDDEKSIFEDNTTKISVSMKNIRFHISESDHPSSAKAPKINWQRSIISCITERPP